MYVRRLTIENVRAISEFTLRLTSEEAPGWHVILGANGAGKSSVVRSLALALAGPKEAAALRQNWATWQRNGAPYGKIIVQIEADTKDVFGSGRRARSIEATLEFSPLDSPIGGPRLELKASGRGPARSIWGTGAGWFSASFGPFRRFTGGDQAFDRLYFSNPRLASHLSAFGEEVALTEGLRWLRELRVKQLEEHADDGALLDGLIRFLNSSDLLPHGARVSEVRSEEVIITDAAGMRVIVEQMSDGYRSLLSMIFEILRQMTKSYGVQGTLAALDFESGCVRLPGVVAIDEVDAHLHPSWQKEIGPWFTRCFPMIQFVVTTHSPIVCRSANSVWKLPEPGSNELARRVEGVELNRLIHGSILDAYGTDFFGRDIARSNDSKALLTELARLNRKALRSALEPRDEERLNELRAMLPTSASDVEHS